MRSARLWRARRRRKRRCVQPILCLLWLVPLLHAPRLWPLPTFSHTHAHPRPDPSPQDDFLDGALDGDALDDVDILGVPTGDTSTI
eukprot:COSAG04_NODE_3024_length_3267_cov_2.198548_3_plen_86_part_00